MKKEKGFTLIELVIVLILLGILAAVAVPKFIDLQDEAKKNAVKGAVASVRSAINIYSADKRLKGYTVYSSIYPKNENALKALFNNNKLPKNPINNLDTVLVDSSKNFGNIDNTNTNGWIYNNQQGLFWSAVSGGFGANAF